MFCPRCGHRVSDTANFCGGCGLPRAEIMRMTQPATPAPQPEKSEIDINEIHSTISQLENDLAGHGTLEDYTTDSTANTNKVENEIVEEIRLVMESKTEEPQSFSGYAPVYPQQSESTCSQSETSVKDDFAGVDLDDNSKEPLSTVDFIWMMIISAIPVVGFIYLIYTAFIQKANVNKSAWAKATLILMVFGLLLSMVFSVGVLASAFIW